MVRRMAQARRIVSEERFVRRQRLLLPNPGDSVVGQVRIKMVIRVMWRFNRLGAIEQGRMPLVGIAADKPVEILEAQARGPEIKRPGLAGLPVGHVVVLPVPGGVPAVLLKDFGHGTATL